MVARSALLCLAAALSIAVDAKATSNTSKSGYNPFAGTWNLTELTITFRNGAVARPEGIHPYGRLILTPGLFFISQFNSEDYASHPFHPLSPLYVAGTDAQNAAVVESSLGLSGTYNVSNEGVYLGLTTSEATVPSFIDSTVKPQNSTFQLTSRNKMIETLALGGGSMVDYQWSRLEVL